MINFILAQVTGGIALLLVMIGYFAKNKSWFYLFQILANVSYALSFIFSASLVAGLNTIVSTIRVIQLYYYEKTTNKNAPSFYIAIYSVLYIIIGIIFFENAYDIIPIICPIIFTIAMWMRNLQSIRYLMVLPNIALGIYAILCQAYTSALLSVIEIIVLIISIIQFEFQKKHSHKQINHTTNVNPINTTNISLDDNNHRDNEIDNITNCDNYDNSIIKSIDITSNDIDINNDSKGNRNDDE